VAGNSIELVDLTKKYGSFTAVDHLNLTIRKGEIFGLLGPNGAGKSTTILMMLGLTEPTSGTVHINGIDSCNNPIEVKRIVGYLPEDVGFYQDSTGLENIIYTAQLNRIPVKLAKEKAEQLLERVGLADAMDKKAGKYSRGMRQRLGLADVLIKDPEIIILDEPTLGIDPTGVKEFLELIVGLSKEDGLTVLFSSHMLHQVQKVCDRVGIFVNGKLLAEGDVPTLAQKLFSHGSITVEAGFSENTDSTRRKNGQKYSVPWLTELLKPVEGILAVTKKDDYFQIECSQDVTSQIARTMIESGAALNYLNRKDYGLDDIYDRYFEGGRV
jgi:ABC-2 type transport system ATP-binding protein